MGNRQDNYSHAANVTPGVGGEVVCVTLILMGMCTFAPAVLLPEWRRLEALDTERQWEAYRLQQIESETAEQKQLLDAIRTDPGVITRLAQRELNMRPVDSIEVPVRPADIDELKQANFKAEPLALPPLLKPLRHVPPRFDYDSVFCDDAVRFPVIGMSIGLVVMALLLFRKGGVEA